MPHAAALQQRPLRKSGFSPVDDAALLATALSHHHSRPMSWHPASTLSAAGYPAPSSCVMTPGTEGLLTTSMSAQASNTRRLHQQSCYSAPEIHLSDRWTALPNGLPVINGSQAEPASWDAGMSDLTSTFQNVSESWSLDTQSMNNSIPSTTAAGSVYEGIPSSDDYFGPATPNFLPIQQPGDWSGSKPGPLCQPLEVADELVGLGLYSDPEDVVPYTAHERTGQGLKLEETFVPTSDMADDDQDADSEDEDEDGTRHEPNNDRNHHDINSRKSEGGGTASAYQNHIPRAEDLPNMSQKSFFFEDDEPAGFRVPTNQQLSLHDQPGMGYYGYGWI